MREGDKATDFTLPSDDGSSVSLSDFRGKKVVLYFYPKDDTPGCTKEACSFRDANSEIIAKGAVVIGVSADNAESHRQFRLKFNLPFYLLSDENHTVLKEYSAWGEKNFMGKLTIGILRSTFIIDENGMIIKHFPKVTPEGHAQEILEYL
ncbi:MAG TPA: thioredoxin-dependent thiol peroxidase [Spirochaetota bacterium]